MTKKTKEPKAQHRTTSFSFGDLAEAYGKAWLAWKKIVDQQDNLKGLDEFDPRSVAWENRLFEAEKKLRTSRETLLLTAVWWMKQPDKDSEEDDEVE